MARGHRAACAAPLMSMKTSQLLVAIYLTGITVRAKSSKFRANCSTFEVQSSNDDVPSSARDALSSARDALNSARDVRSSTLHAFSIARDGQTCERAVHNSAVDASHTAVSAGISNAPTACLTSAPEMVQLGA